MTATRPHVGEGGVCDPDCPGCHYPGNGNDCPDWQERDADRPCDVCSGGGAVSAQTAADLRAAAEVLRRDGWTTQCRRDGASGRCATDALAIAVDPTDWDSEKGWDNETNRRYSAAAQALRDYIGDRIVPWEEAEGRTADEVIAALEAAADAAEAAP